MRHVLGSVLALSLATATLQAQSADYGRWPGTITLNSGMEVPYVELYWAIIPGDEVVRRADFVVSVDQFLKAEQVEEFLCRFIAKKGRLIPTSLRVLLHLYYRLPSFGGVSDPSLADETLITAVGCSDEARSTCSMAYFTDVRGKALRPVQDFNFSCESLGLSFAGKDKDPR